MNTGENRKPPCPETFCESKTITEIESESIVPVGRYGPLMSKIPVVVSKNKVQLHLEAKVHLDRFVTAIRQCTRTVNIAQCKLLDLDGKKTGKLYLDGHIREKVEYSVAANPRNPSSSSDIRYKIVKIPFECSAKIDYYSPPRLKFPNRFISIALPPPETMVDSSWEMAGNPCAGCTNRGAGYGFANMFCEVDETTVLVPEIPVQIPCPGRSRGNEDFLDTLTEFMVVSITLTLLQWQWVNISRNSAYPNTLHPYST